MAKKKSVKTKPKMTSPVVKKGTAKAAAAKAVKPQELPVSKIVPHETNPHVHYVLNMELHNQVVAIARVNEKRETWKMFLCIHPGTSRKPAEIFRKAILNKAVPAHVDVLAPLLFPVLDDKYTRET